MRGAEKLILGWWPDLDWRHHGTGMLQAYAPGDDRRRVHIWHPSLLLAGMAESGAMHNHRFALRSLVVVGSLWHTHLVLEPDADGAHYVWDIGEASRGEDSDLVRADRVRLVFEPHTRFGRGATYEVRKWEFHWARPAESLAITLVRLIDKDHDRTASLVAPVDRIPTHAFGHTPNADMIGALLSQARASLEGM